MAKEENFKKTNEKDSKIKTKNIKENMKEEKNEMENNTINDVDKNVDNNETNFSDINECHTKEIDYVVSNGNIVFSENQGLNLSSKHLTVSTKGCYTSTISHHKETLENCYTQDLFVFKSVLNDKMYNLNDVINTRPLNSTKKEQEEFKKYSSLREKINNILIERIIKLDEENN